MNIASVDLVQAPREELQEMVARGDVSEQALIPPFQNLTRYGVRAPDTGVPALDLPTKPGGFPNYSPEAYIDFLDRYFSDTISYSLSHPTAVARNFATSHQLFFSPVAGFDRACQGGVSDISAMSRAAAHRYAGSSARSKPPAPRPTRSTRPRNPAGGRFANPVEGVRFDLCRRRLYLPRFRELDARRTFVVSRRLVFVTVVFEPEYLLLWLQARSMAAFLPDELVEEIVVIDNSARSMPARIREQVLGEYGPLSAKVRILRPRDICPIPRTVGYRSQQVLKLSVAGNISTERYVVLDAKNHFVAAVGRGLFEAPDGRARLGTNSYESHRLRPRLEHALQYLGLNPRAYVQQFTTTVPPFVFVTAVVKSMIDDIERRSGRSFPREFDANALTEFFLYAAWIVANDGSLDDIYELQPASQPYVWAKTADRDGVERAIQAATDARSAVFAVHRLALSRLDADSARALSDFWVSRGLFSTRGEAERFIVEFSRAYQRAELHARVRDLPRRARGLPRYLRRKLVHATERP